jgi:hypothetical protein
MRSPPEEDGRSEGKEGIVSRYPRIDDRGETVGAVLLRYHSDDTIVGNYLERVGYGGYQSDVHLRNEAA